MVATGKLLPLILDVTKGTWATFMKVFGGPLWLIAALSMLAGADTPPPMEEDGCWWAAQGKACRS